MVPAILVVNLATHAWVITINVKFVKINHELKIRVVEFWNLELIKKDVLQTNNSKIKIESVYQNNSQTKNSNYELSNSKKRIKWLFIDM